jgi:HPt (histidine-containing phosphotransfer) domain-containing protein
LRPAVVTELVTLFKDETPPRIAALRAALGRHDPTQLAQAAHRLKGEAGVIGAYELEDLARQLEQLGNSGTIVGAETLLERVEPAFHRAAAVLRTG